MSNPLKSRFMLLRSMADGSMLMDDASNAGMFDRSRFMPERSKLLDRSAPSRPDVNAFSSNMNALCNFSPSMVNKLDISSWLPSFASSSSSANDLPVMTFFDGFAI